MISIVTNFCLEILILSILTFLISFVICSVIKLFIDICNAFNLSRGIKIEKLLSNQYNSSKYTFKYVAETSSPDLEDVFINFLEVYKDESLFFRHQFNPVVFYFSKISKMYDYLLDVINRYEEKNAIFLEEMLDNIDTKQLIDSIDSQINYAYDFEIYEHIDNKYGDIPHKEFLKLEKLYIDGLTSIYLDLTNYISKYKKDVNYKEIREGYLEKDYSSYKDCNLKFLLDDVLSNNKEKIKKEYAQYLVEIIDKIYIRSNIDDLLNKIDNDNSKESV